MTGRWSHKESEEEDRFAIHMPAATGTGSKTRSRKTRLPYQRPDLVGEVGGVCVSRARVRRQAHCWDKEGRCIFCDEWTD